jgi:hypothetical protein
MTTRPLVLARRSLPRYRRPRGPRNG